MNKFKMGDLVRLKSDARYLFDKNHHGPLIYLGRKSTEQFNNNLTCWVIEIGKFYSYFYPKELEYYE